MTDTIKQGNQTDLQTSNPERRGDRCPECGSELIQKAEEPVVCNYPAPQLELVSCSSGDCSYRKYRKLDEESRTPPTGRDI